MILKIRVITLILLLFSCGSKRMATRQEIAEFVLDQKNGLNIIKRVQDFEIQLTFKPSDLIADERMVSDRRYEFDSLSGQLSKYYYFIFKIKLKGKDLGQYYVLNEG